MTRIEIDSVIPRKSFYQWDKNQRIKLYDIPENAQIHFSSTVDRLDALVVKPYIENDVWYANVPNCMFTLSGTITVFVYRYEGDVGYTEFKKDFKVNPREKPDDYVYTETELEDYKRISEGYEQNVHYEQTTKEVMEILQPLSDNLQYMTYRKRSLLSSVNTNTDGFGYDDSKMQITLPMKTGFSIYQAPPSLSNTLELDMYFHFLTYYAYGVSMKQYIRMNLNTIAVNGGSHTAQYAMAGVMQFSESIKDVDYVYYMDDGDEKNSIIEKLLSPIPVLIQVLDDALIFTFRNYEVYSILIDDCLEAGNSDMYYIKAELYNVEYYTPQELSDALDKLSGEVI